MVSAAIDHVKQVKAMKAVSSLPLGMSVVITKHTVADWV